MLKLIFTKSWNNCHRPTLNPLLSLKAGFLTGNLSKNFIKFLSNLLVFTAELLNELRRCLWYRYRFAEFSLDLYLSSSFTSFSSLSWFAANMKKRKKLYTENIWKITHPRLERVFSWHTIVVSTAKERQLLEQLLMQVMRKYWKKLNITYLFSIAEFHITLHYRTHFSHVYPCFDSVKLSLLRGFWLANVLQSDW